MDRLSLALTVIFFVVGAVMAAVWALAHFGSRAMLRPLSARTRRRLGFAMIGFGILHLAIFLPMAILDGDIGRLLFSLVQGGFFLAWGVEILRRPRPAIRGGAVDVPLSGSSGGSADDRVTSSTQTITFMGRPFKMGSSGWYRRLEEWTERHPVFVGLSVLAIVIGLGLMTVVRTISRLDH